MQDLPEAKDLEGLPYGSSRWTPGESRANCEDSGQPLQEKGSGCNVGPKWPKASGAEEEWAHGGARRGKRVGGLSMTLPIIMHVLYKYPHFYSSSAARPFLPVWVLSTP